MKTRPNTALIRRFACLALSIGLLHAFPVLAAPVVLATSPLADSTSTAVKPNLMFILDNSGSMNWDHMPDDAADLGSSVTFQFGYYGFRSSQCNQVYFNPSEDYLPPLDAAGVVYANASFIAAKTNGFDSASTATNLNNQFKASTSMRGDSLAQSAYYYTYLGAVTTKDYNSTTNTFYTECNNSTGSDVAKIAPVRGVSSTLSAANGGGTGNVFVKHRLATTETTTITISGSGSTTVSDITVNGVSILSNSSTTSTSNAAATDIAAKITALGYSAAASGSVITITYTGTTSPADYTPMITSTSGGMTFTPDVFPITNAAALTKFANWYSFYRTRLLMMKTASGRAFTSLNKNYRVGFMKISSSSTPTLRVNPFWNNTDTTLGAVSTQRTDWYNALYNATTSGSTPLRVALADAGKYYAGKATGALAGSATDPLEYSCQPNYSILSTDGFWNGNPGEKLDGTDMDNQDALALRPYKDGAQAMQSTTRVSQTQTQTALTTSQLQQTQRKVSQLQQSTTTLQSSTWPLIKTTTPLDQSAYPLIKTTTPLDQSAWTLQSQASTLQTSTMYLQTRTSANSGGTWTAWASAASCTWDTGNPSLRECRYAVASGASTIAWTAAAATWTNATGNCTVNFSTGTSGTWSGNKTNCQYTAYTAAAPAASCTYQNKTAASPYSVLTARICSYGATPTPTSNVASCTTSAKTTATTNGTVYNNAAKDCTYSTTPTVDTAATACTIAAQSTGAAKTGPAVSCSYGTAVPTSNVASCTTSAKTTATTNGTVYNNAAKDCTYSTTPTVDTAATACTIAAQSTGAAKTGPAVSCSYGTAVVTTPASCTVSAKTTATSNGTVYNATANTCAYSTPAVVTNVSSCTPVAASTSSPYTVATATSCGYTAWPTAWTNVNAGTCTAAAQDTATFNMTATSGVATQCRTVGVAGCAGGTTCTTVTTGGATNYVASCTNAFANSGNSYTATSCTTTPYSATAFVNSCSAGTGPAPDNVTTSCNTTVTPLVAVNSCTAQAASDANNHTATTCSNGGGGSAGSLADVAMYYYQTDLRDTGLSNCTGALGADVCLNNVDESFDTQHMSTFTLSLGVSGRMKYVSSDYATASTGDYYAVANGSSANSAATPDPICAWQANGTACNWPVPGLSSGGDGFIENIDDLWHAAVNGRGTYFSATNPRTLSDGLSEALASITASRGAAAAAATSTLNPVADNNFAYVASYTTVSWKGNLEQRSINTVNGEVSETALWCVENIQGGDCATGYTKTLDSSGSGTAWYCSAPAIDVNAPNGIIDAADCTAPYTFHLSGTTEFCRKAIADSCSGTLPLKVAAATDTRNIYTAVGNTRIDFSPNSAFNTAYADYFDDDASGSDISGLSQWSATSTKALTPAQKTAAVGDNLVNYLRGQTQHEFDRTGNSVQLYRKRDATFGDALESQPTFVAAPTFNYGDAGYAAFKSLYANRAGTVFIGANDGMMHAFASSNGVERFAYVPSMVIPNMWKLADHDYANLHTNYVNGSAVISDICPNAPSTTCSASEWKTILVGGLNAGGRGYYALDITDPTATDYPKLLWEFTPTDTDATDLGYSYGKPIVTKKQDGTWVVLVTSGYDNGTLSADNLTANDPFGDGKGHLYVLNANTGAVVSDIPTTEGSVGTPSGLARFNAYNEVVNNNQAGFVYGGDLEGNLWRFDINSVAASGTNPLLLATLRDSSAVAQPITVAPTLGKINNQDIRDASVIFVGTGKYLEVADLDDTQTQSLYAIKDDGTAIGNPRARTKSVATQTDKMVLQTIAATNRAGSFNDVDFSVDRGWYVDFPDAGERTNIDFKLVQGTLIVPTIVPSETACEPGGYGWLNYFNYESGQPVQTEINPNTIVSQRYSSPIVGVNVIYIGGQPIVEVVTSTDPTPKKPDVEVPFRDRPGGFMKIRETWRELIP
ncbi:MAG: PilC/PilY family type IV pilus protein [Gallionella sp.]